MRKKKNSEMPTMFDVDAVKKVSEVNHEVKKRFLVGYNVDDIGINASYKKYGHVLRNRNNNINLT